MIWLLGREESGWARWVGGGPAINVRPLYVDHDCEVLWPAGLFISGLDVIH